MSRVLTLTPAVVFGCWLPVACWAQVNTGSDGTDGALNPASSININMSSRPSGIYQYTSVNIRSNVTVTFTPNANNTPVVWLVQGDVVINGTVDVSGGGAAPHVGGAGGVGGYAGGGGVAAMSGGGPGGGRCDSGNAAANAGYNYGNNFLVPLLGGSGGGGFGNSGSGGGGGGAIVIAASSNVTVAGTVLATGGSGYWYGGGGSGGAIRLVAQAVTVAGRVDASGGGGSTDFGSPMRAGDGRIRFDRYGYRMSGGIVGNFTWGFQPVIVPVVGHGAQLTVTGVGGVPVAAPPSGQVQTPDAVLSAQQNNPIPVWVSCANLPLNTAITVSVRPVSGASVSAVGYNSNGTFASSTATVMLNIPRGGGIVYATAAASN